MNTNTNDIPAPATGQYLTLVYKPANNLEARRILDGHPWVHASWSHAVKERDSAKGLVEDAIRERDEADRRAGAAERRAAGKSAGLLDLEGMLHTGAPAVPVADMNISQQRRARLTTEKLRAVWYSAPTDVSALRGVETECALAWGVTLVDSSANTGPKAGGPASASDGSQVPVRIRFALGDPDGSMTLAQLTRHADLLRQKAASWDVWSQAQGRVEKEMPKGWAVSIQCSPGDWDLWLSDPEGERVDFSHDDSETMAEVINEAINAARKVAGLPPTAGGA